ncbi:RidA family protein [Solibacillus sp. MA9]|uniref:RidA family protein n=1 Tax=Solibacillus palustris TaxID=2908203 RepID=A0ABS9UGW5_9BACL|nr:RidA family protein [Solibacillus sp. MA9]MCH7323170.1 RidA family protein [Solibacillus sp. MA9]
MMHAGTPIPQGKYVPAKRVGNLIFTAGMTPRENGVLIQSGKIKSDFVIENVKQAIRLAATNTLSASLKLLDINEKIESVISMTVYINTEENFELHSKIADIASDYYFEVLGEAGIGSRAAVGVASLPGNAPIEIQLVVSVTEVENS